jgi:putrescine aminotransferase
MSFSHQDKARIVKRFARHVNSGQVKYLRAGHLDVLESQREGTGFTDPLSQTRMDDAFTAAGCFNVGRGNPVVRAALDEALQKWDMGTPGLDSEPKRALRSKLAAIAPGDLNKVLLCAGGGDAVDAAIKLARAATGRPEILATDKAYHGHTGFALSANGKAHYRDYCEPLMPGFRFVPFNDLAAMRRQVSESTAAILVEPVQGEAGIYAGTSEYLEGLRELADVHGALLIFDEVQTGFGRTGKMFAAEYSGVVPDIMAVAKSIGGGLYPNAAIMWRDRPDLSAFISLNPHFHRSMGGTDLGCAVSVAVIEFIEHENLCSNAARQGGRLMDVLLELQSMYPKIIRDVRGIGLMLGLEYIHEFLGPMMSDALARRGVFAAYSGNAPQVMRFMVPLTVTDDDVDRIGSAIRAAVSDMQKLLPLTLPAARVPALRRLLNNERVQTGLFGALRSVEDAFHRFRRSSHE